MDLKLNDKRALVSGSTKGIGMAIATRLAGEGARVIVNGRNAGSVADALAQIRAAVPGAQLDGHAGDLSDAAATDELVR